MPVNNNRDFEMLDLLFEQRFEQLCFQELWTDSPYSSRFSVNPFANDGNDFEENKKTGIYIFLLICVNLSIFICCGIRSSGTSDDSNKQPLCSMGEPPFDVDCLRRKPHHESTESLTTKDELDGSMV
jgi:hypothetical protein